MLHVKSFKYKKPKKVQAATYIRPLPIPVLRNNNMCSTIWRYKLKTLKLASYFVDQIKY